MTWVGYVRVSTKEQHTENQIPKIEAYFKARGIEDYIIIHEKESTTKTRPIKNQIYLDALEGKYDGVVVLRLERWARSLQEMILELDAFAKRNVVFVSISDLGEIDYNTPSGRLQVNIFSAFAEFERDIQKVRQAEGILIKKKKLEAEGKRYGRPKGSRDKKPRSKSGYYNRYAKGGKKK